ncbi:MAG: hypothetical protein KF817_13495 [Phycisphaeraceae bacterium]|nr:hypothetical protein [Phycisphaeraceae bacterium]
MLGAATVIDRLDLAWRDRNHPADGARRRPRASFAATGALADPARAPEAPPPDRPQNGTTR